jgi:HD-GYP domain-containing protein (c-di-GMP phosphodiesterase class II)
MPDNKDDNKDSEDESTKSGDDFIERRKKNLEAIRQYSKVYDDKIKRLADIGIALSAEKDIEKLLQMIVDEATDFTNADGGTLYILEEGHLHFKIMLNKSMNFRAGGTSNNPINLPPVKLDPHNVSANAALTGETINIPDVYEAEGFDFTGPRKYDEATGYRSKSMLVVPMENQDAEIIGVLQLLNTIDPISGEVVSFHDENVALTRSLASQAAVSITNTRLIQDMEELFNSFVRVMATAIDERSPYTGGHIRRVAELGELMCDVINNADAGKFKDVTFSPDEQKEMMIAGWMHDVGKVTTPVHIMDKSTKLETISDTVELVKSRFGLIEAVIRNEWLEKKTELLETGAPKSDIEKGEVELKESLEQLHDDLEFLVKSNTGGEFMSDDKLERVKAIGERTYSLNGDNSRYLSDGEVENLCIRKGTLLDSERKLMQDHVVVTAKMLKQIPFTKALSRVPEFASGHHECVDGSGYPLGLKGDELSLGARILNLVDFYEALSASDRPYKKAMPIEKVLSILQAEADHGKIDADLLALFLKERVWELYEAQEVLKTGPDKVKDGPKPAETQKADATAVKS